MKFTKSNQRRLAKLADKHRNSFGAGKPLTKSEAKEYTELSLKAASIIEQELLITTKKKSRADTYHGCDKCPHCGKYLDGHNRDLGW